VIGALAPGGDTSGSRYSLRALPGSAEQARALAEFARREFAPASVVVRADPAANAAAPAAAAPASGASAAVGQMGTANAAGAFPVPVVIGHADEPAMRALADALDEQLRAGGWARVLRYDGGPLMPAGLDAWRASPARLLFYFGRERELGHSIAALKGQAGPVTVLGLAGQLGKTAAQLPAALAAGRYLALPWSPTTLAEPGRIKLAQLRAAPEARGASLAALVDAELNAEVLIEGLKRGGRAPSRAKLVDAIENLFNFETGLATPITFGPGRRVGVRGAHVVSLNADGAPTRPPRFVALEGGAQ
jgi:hypothetical protein